MKRSILVLSILVNIGIMAFIIRAFLVMNALRSAASGYSYVGNDYPLEYPIGNLDTVAMSLHESVHYSLNTSNPFAETEWKILAAYPKGVGRTRLGPEHRLFVMTFHHQLHCLRQFQLGLMAVNGSPRIGPHIHHCLNYLRQTFICSSLDMLEKGDFMERNYGAADRLGDDLVCQDWTMVYDSLDSDYEAWLEWSSRQN